MLLLNKANFSPPSLSGGIQIKLDTMRFSFISRIVELLKRLLRLKDRGKACVNARRGVENILHRAALLLICRQEKGVAFRG